MLEARTEYLRDAIDLVIVKYRTIEKYLIEGCGIPENRINYLKGKYSIS